MRKFILIAIVLLLTVLAACSSEKDDIKSGKKSHNPKSGDTWEQTTSKEELPGFLDESDENMHTLYLAVAQHQDLLQQIPCYCGCGESADHTSNHDCFIYDNSPKAVTWDNHAITCQACLDIAAKSISKSIDGIPVQDIRKDIDQEYKEGYADPTPTPEV